MPNNVFKLIYSSQVLISFIYACCGIKTYGSGKDMLLVFYFSYHYTLYKPRKYTWGILRMPSNDYIEIISSFFFNHLKFLPE